MRRVGVHQTISKAAHQACGLRTRRLVRGFYFQKVSRARKARASGTPRRISFALASRFGLTSSNHDINDLVVIT